MAESENIVVETAEKIFADLADAQTINRDKKGDWKAPLWQALSEAGLPLAWVPEEQGGSGASLADGFAVLNAAGRHAIAVPLAETMLAGWLLAQAKISSPEGEMTVIPATPKDRITHNADGTLSGRARSVPFAKAAKHFAVLRRQLDCAGRRGKMPDRSPASALAATTAISSCSTRSSRRRPSPRRRALTRRS